MGQNSQLSPEEKVAGGATSAEASLKLMHSRGMDNHAAGGVRNMSHVIQRG
jgi:hypothetical protein